MASRWLEVDIDINGPLVATGQPDLAGKIWRLPSPPTLSDMPALLQSPQAAPGKDYIEIPVLRNGETAKPDDTRTYDKKDWRAEVYKSAVPAITRIEVEKNDGTSGFATGFFVSPDGLMATDHHVADNAKTLSIELSNGRKYSAHVVGNNPANDLALLQVDGQKPGEKFAFLPLAKQGTKLAPEDQVVMVGHPQGWAKNYLSEGSFAAPATGVDLEGKTALRNPYREVLRFNMHGEGGNSGSPVLNKNGEVVGVLDAAVPKDVNESVVNPVSELRRMVPGYKEKEEIAFKDFVIPSRLHFDSSQLPFGMLGGLQASDAFKAGVANAKPSLGLPAFAAWDLAMHDASYLKSSINQGTTGETVSAGIDVTSDAMMIGGVAGMFFPQYRALSNTVQLLGTGLKLGNSVLGNRRY